MKSRFLMIMILSVMLTGTFIGTITLKKESRQDTPETEPVSPSEGSAVVTMFIIV